MGSAEHDRLHHPDPVEVAAWRAWGPFVAERQWGTVREDYRADGDAWRAVTHDQARSYAYRWGEDGLAAVCDRRQGVCLGLALWNGRDPILKERLFGLTNTEGNHGEDVKERYWYRDATPTHSWLAWRYQYPQEAFPYDDLVAGNAARGLDDREYELADTGVLAGGWWEVDATWAKADPADLCLRVVARNRGSATETLHILPGVWFRNVWSWGRGKRRPRLRGHAHAEGPAVVVDHEHLGRWVAVAGPAGDDDGELLFCENESNRSRLWGQPPLTPFPKDGINDHVVHGAATVNPGRTGTRAAWWFRRSAPPGETVEIRLRFRRVSDEPVPPPPRPLLPTPGERVDNQTVAQPPGSGSAGAQIGGDGHDRDRDRHHDGDGDHARDHDDAGDGGADAEEDDAALDAVALPAGALGDLGDGFEEVLRCRQAEADAFYAVVLADVPPEEAVVARQAFAGLLWSEQFYRYAVGPWLDGDPGQPPPPPGRGEIRNGRWRHLDANEVIVMPDKWEYPWFASWDLAFHCVALAHVDPALAKEQLELLCRVWYQHPNGALPAYEWSFDDANPPVHAWAARRVFELAGSDDHEFLERIFVKLLLNFTWWVNREDAQGDNCFEGGFLGLDNIGPFNRSQRLAAEGVLEQSDGTGWMAMYCLDLLSIALTLAARDPVYEDLAVKFFEHFALIVDAMNQRGFWSDEDGFFYDIVRMADGSVTPLPVQSMVGVIPTLAVTIIRDTEVAGLPEFLARVRWFLEHRPSSTGFFGRYRQAHAVGLLSVVSPERLARILANLLDEERFLSPFGLRSLSRWHRDHPVVVELGGTSATVGYEPGESASRLFGGNSNWRGPVWFPINFLVIEALRRFHTFAGDTFRVELPTGSGRWATADEVADELAGRLVSLFLPDPQRGGRWPALGEDGGPDRDPLDPADRWFSEYFHGDDGRGLGASHQTGWTALVADLVLSRRRP